MQIPEQQVWEEAGGSTFLTSSQEMQTPLPSRRPVARPRVCGEPAELAQAELPAVCYTDRFTVTPHHEMMVPLYPALCQVWEPPTTTIYPEEDPRTSRGPYSHRKETGEKSPWLVWRETAWGGEGLPLEGMRGRLETPWKTGTSDWKFSGREGFNTLKLFLMHGSLKPCKSTLPVRLTASAGFQALNQCFLLIVKSGFLFRLVLEIDHLQALFQI